MSPRRGLPQTTHGSGKDTEISRKKQGPQPASTTNWPAAGVGGFQDPTANSPSRERNPGPEGRYSPRHQRSGPGFHHHDIGTAERFHRAHRYRKMAAEPRRSRRRSTTDLRAVL